MDKSNRTSARLRRGASLLLLPLLAFGALLTGCRPAAGALALAEPAAPAVALTAAAPKGCSEGLLAASAWECLRAGLHAAHTEARR